MPIQLDTIPDNPLLCGYVWTFKDEELLSRLVARILLGHFRHVEKIIAKLKPKALSFGSAAGDQAKAKLILKSGEPPWHRDGLLFQAISWIAAHQAASSNSVFSVPHQIPAHKGFDGLQIDLDANKQLIALLIFEDKATDNPRATILKDVWPELARLHKDDRQAELMQETTALLQRTSLTNIDDILEGIVWKSIRGFRVSITANVNDHAPTKLHKLFGGYDEALPGTSVASRRAEVVFFSDLRPWMQAFADKVIQAIDKEQAVSNV